MKERKLYNEFGFSSTVHYAETVCGFSDKKTRYLLFIGEKLERFRKIRASFMKGRLGWTKVRELLKIVTPDTEEDPLELAVKLTNRKLEALVALKREERATKKHDALTRARIAIESSSSRSMSGPSNSPDGGFPQNSKDCITQTTRNVYGDLWKEVEVQGLDHVVQSSAVREEEPKLSVTFNFTPEEHVLLNRFLVEWRKRNPDIRKREEAIIRLLREYMDNPAHGKSENEPVKADDSKESRITVVEPPYEVVIHHCPECERNTIVTDRGEIGVGKPLLERALCDGVVYEPTGKASAGNNGAGVRTGSIGAEKEAVGLGTNKEAVDVGSEKKAVSDDARKEAVGTNTGKDVEVGALPGRRRKTVTPALRKRIILRDRGRCTTPGCRHEKYLEIHHIVPTSKGGKNDPSNLTTVCGRCHKNIHLGKLKIRGAYPDIESIHGAPDGAEEPLGTTFHYRRGGETGRVKENTPVWIYSKSNADLQRLQGRDSN